MSLYRVTPRTTAQQTLDAMRQHQDRLGQLQAQITTGLRLQRPSNDPVAYQQWQLTESQSSRLEGYLKNVTASRSHLDSQVSSLVEIKNLLVRAKSLALDAPGNTERSDLAAEVEQIRTSLIEAANHDFQGRYLFAGEAYDRQPFVVEQLGNSQKVVYHGSATTAAAPIGSGLQAIWNLSGAEVFSVRSDAPLQIIGSTGTGAGLGTANGSGFALLQVAHTSTSYSGASGIAAGSGSAAGDTILGPPGTHTLTIVDTSGTGASGTVSLNGGAPVAFTSSDTNLLVEGPLGERVFVDTTSIAAGFSGSVNVAGNGTLSLDGGATTEPITFDSNQPVTNSQTGELTYLDTTQVRRTGTDRLEYGRATDVFQTLELLKRDLTNADGLSEAEIQDALQRRIGELDGAIESVLAATNRQSATLATLDAIQTRHEDTQLHLAERSSELSGTDFAEAVIQLQQQQNLLEYTYASSVRLFSLSLLDFLR